MELLKERRAVQKGLKDMIRALGPWFHNLRIHGFETAPNHFLGDYPQVKFAGFCDAIPEDMRTQCRAARSPSARCEPTNPALPVINTWLLMPERFPWETERLSKKLTFGHIDPRPTRRSRQRVEHPEADWCDAPRFQDEPA